MVVRGDIDMWMFKYQWPTLTPTPSCKPMSASHVVRSCIRRGRLLDLSVSAIASPRRNGGKVKLIELKEKNEIFVLSWRSHYQNFHA